MSVKSNQIPSISYELDIVKVAYSLGIDHVRLLAYVYANVETMKSCDEKDISPDIQG
ncbi:hypothetical protein [Paenibacillus alba]|uniref:Uncharacterized protein n=1 Tax=Paenibacillus alba TaxID=1197127 RepID=A0ABU6GBS9_9BACL|nr:hypothetical protein [Paenibacillus alba]MEC0230169.1 hypothetical protein [Paenibacillus alba]NQX68256.1 hypothetical protein [Paenibacillus alba]